MTNPLHHTLRNRTSAKLLLCRQWVERINYEHTILSDNYVVGNADEYQVWHSRLMEDIHTLTLRLLDDGYMSDMTIHVDTPAIWDNKSDFAFTPLVERFGGSLPADKIQVWRKAVQS